MCGYPELRRAPWVGTRPSDEICSCCGIHFGLDDVTDGSRAQAYLQWRQRWIADGCPWFSRSRHPPPGWDAEAQVRTVAGLVVPPVLAGQHRATSWDVAYEDGWAGVEVVRYVSSMAPRVHLVGRLTDGPLGPPPPASLRPRSGWRYGAPVDRVIRDAIDAAVPPTVRIGRIDTSDETSPDICRQAVAVLLAALFNDDATVEVAIRAAVRSFDAPPSV